MTLFTLVWLSAYFIINIWVFVWRYLKLGDLIDIEENSLELMEESRMPLRRACFFPLISSNSPFFSRETLNLESLNLHKIRRVTQVTAGLSILSMIASTSPFIGLFGTVVEILQAFYQLGGSKVSFDIIAPIISKALVATAFGILTAIPAYTFFIILKRRAFILISYLDMQINLILSLPMKPTQPPINASNPSGVMGAVSPTHIAYSSHSNNVFSPQ